MERAYDTLILSDVHLGSEISRARDALDVLKSTTFRRLILLGDIVNDLNFRRLKKEHWQFLSYIRKLSNPKRNVEVVWVEGNHDLGLADLMSHLVGIRLPAVQVGILRRALPRDPWTSIRSFPSQEFPAQPNWGGALSLDTEDRRR